MKENTEDYKNRYDEQIFDKKSRQFVHKQERILAPAIKRLYPRDVVENPYWKNDILDIEIGYRHPDIMRRFSKEISKKPSAQGFYTTYGRFVDRTEGMKIAYEAGQVDNFTAFGDDESHDYNEDNYREVFKDLFSEDLY